MRLHRVGRDVQALCDVLRVVALDERLEHLQLARGEQVLLRHDFARGAQIDLRPGIPGTDEAPARPDVALVRQQQRGQGGTARSPAAAMIDFATG